MLLLRKNALKEWASPHAVNRKKTTDVLYISVDQQWQFCSLKIKHTKFHVSINIACIFTDFYLYFLSFKFKMLDLYFEQQHKHFGVFKSTLTILHSNFSNHPKFFFFSKQNLWWVFIKRFVKWVENLHCISWFSFASLAEFQYIICRRLLFASNTFHKNLCICRKFSIGT